MNTVCKFTFYVKVDAPAGFITDEVSVLREYSTDDADHAIELAFRDWDSIKPENYIEGTLSIINEEDELAKWCDEKFGEDI